jgi:hypothetical protein
MTFPRHMSPRLSMKADPALPGSDLYPQSKGDPGKIIFYYVTLYRKRMRKIIVLLTSKPYTEPGDFGFPRLLPSRLYKQHFSAKPVIFYTRAFHFFQLCFACRPSYFVASNYAGIDPGAGSLRVEQNRDTAKIACN